MSKLTPSSTNRTCLRRAWHRRSTGSGPDRSDDRDRDSAATCVRGDNATSGLLSGNATTGNDRITHCRSLRWRSALPILSHPDPLVFPALAAHASLHICGVRPVFQVITAGCRQGCLQLLGPFRVGLGQSPYLIGSQAKVAKHRAERLTGINGVQELLPHLNW
jgi:hypothetical protein